MKAIIWTAYGPPEVLQPGERPKPEPGEDEVLVRIQATSVTAGDCELRGLAVAPWLAAPFRLYVGLRRPTRVLILGQELSGVVEAAGAAVTRFRPGDAVYATTGLRLGAYAEYTCLPAAGGGAVVALKPANLTFEEAAAVPTAGLEAQHLLRQANLRPGARLLVNGAGGSIGTMAVQLGRHFGAEVTAVDSAVKLDMLHDLGASHVLDYAREDFTAGNQTYDAIFDVTGKLPMGRTLERLKPGGRLLLANPPFSQKLRPNERVVTTSAAHSVADLEALTALIEAGHLRPVIDRVYPLELAAEAHRYAETGEKRGNIVLRVEETMRP